MMSTGCSKCGQPNLKDLLLPPYLSLPPAEKNTVVSDMETKFGEAKYNKGLTCTVSKYATR